MAGTLIHFGADRCSRMLILSSVGYLTNGCESLTQFSQLLQERTDTQAILLAESSRRERRQAVTLARSYSVAPLILFDDLNTGEGEKEFDLVIPPLTRPEEWLDKIAATIAQSRALIQDSAAIRDRSQSLVTETKLLGQKSALERRRAREARAHIDRVIRGEQGTDFPDET